jgi:hypothetical protein
VCTQNTSMIADDVTTYRLKRGYVSYDDVDMAMMSTDLKTSVFKRRVECSRKRRVIEIVSTCHRKRK